jgi:phosphoserine phosphatase
MQHILVLTGRPGALDHNIMGKVAHVLGHGVHWLDPGTACEIPVDGEVDRRLRDIRAALAEYSVDANVIPIEGRRKRLLIADMDSTIIACECIDELADAAGLMDKVAAITERAMRGELVFEDSLRERVALLMGLPVVALEQVYRERVRLNPGARALVQTMNAAGAITALVSGGFTFFTEKVAADAGFAVQCANKLLIDGERLTGFVAEPILGRAAKRDALIELAGGNGLSLDQTMAVGDGSNDLSMIEAAGYGVAYRAKPILKAAAHAQLDHSDLTALLYLQGYRADELVTD